MNRRDFLKGSAMAAGVMAAGGAFAAGAREIKVAVVGCGGRGTGGKWKPASDKDFYRAGALGNRKIPGSDGALDNYVEGFTALKMLGYRGAVSMEAGWVAKGKDAKGKPIFPDNVEKHQILTRMCAMLREQWAMA